MWLEAKNFNTSGMFKKLCAKQKGPFWIKRVIGPLVYQLELLQSWKIHNVFHASLLTPYQENDTHGPNFSNPPPDLVDGEEEYEIEAIKGHQPFRGYWRYLVKWKGYPTSENSWHTASELKNALEILQEYKKTHKIPVRPPSRK